MSLIDDLKGGFKVGTWGGAAAYIGSVWQQKITFPTSDLTGMTLAGYAIKDEFASEKEFDLDIETEEEGANTHVFVSATEANIKLLSGCTQFMPILEITEDATSKAFIYKKSYVAVHSGYI